MDGGEGRAVTLVKGLLVFVSDEEGEERKMRVGSGVREQRVVEKFEDEDVQLRNAEVDRYFAHGRKEVMRKFDVAVVVNGAVIVRRGVGV